MGIARVWGVVLLAVFVCAVFPPAGVGATAGVFDGRLFYGAAAGEANRVEISESNGTVTIRDQGAVITADDGCVQVTAQEVQCASVDSMDVRLDDLDDTAAVLRGGSRVRRYGDPHIRGGDGNDVITGCGRCRLFAAGDDGDDVITANGFLLVGNAGNDTITGGDSSDRLYGGTGNDTLRGGSGGDHFFPGRGDDFLRGGRGPDVARFGLIPSPIVVDLAAGRATGQGVDTLVSIQNIGGTLASDRLKGNGQANVLGGGSGDDVVIGGGGDDLLVGNGGQDTLRGGAGNDGFRARDGTRDIVRGARGRDWASVDPRLDRVSGVQIFR